MNYLLDTDICIYIIKRHPASVVARLRGCVPGEVALSSLTVAELRFGAEKSQSPDKNHDALDHFLSPFEVLPFDERVGAVYGEVRAKLERRGTPIGPLDTLIAAHALALGVTLVTNNEREFARVAGLRWENWVN